MRLRKRITHVVDLHKQCSITGTVDKRKAEVDRSRHGGVVSKREGLGNGILSKVRMKL